MPRNLAPGTYELALTVTDGRGGEARDSMTLTIDPFVEIVTDGGWQECCGGWNPIDDPSAAEGVRMFHPNTSAPKLAAPLANPANYFDVTFTADPSQVYKLWIRLNAQDDAWANDSIFVQFSGAVDQAGNTYAIGTTSGLAVNLEECSGCGISGWGWRDERWGAALNSTPVLLQFPAGGRQTIRIQTREDGVSVDTIVLSAQEFKSTPPGPAKGDTRILWRTTR